MGRIYGLEFVKSVMKYKNIIIMVILLVLITIVIILPEEPLQETELDVKSKCRIILKSIEDIPEETIIYCRNLLKDEHET